MRIDQVWLILPRENERKSSVCSGLNVSFWLVRVKAFYPPVTSYTGPDLQFTTVAFVDHKPPMAYCRVLRLLTTDRAKKHVTVSSRSTRTPRLVWIINNDRWTHSDGTESRRFSAWFARFSWFFFLNFNSWFRHETVRARRAAKESRSAYFSRRFTGPRIWHVTVGGCRAQCGSERLCACVCVCRLQWRLTGKTSDGVRWRRRRARVPQWKNGGQTVLSVRGAVGGGCARVAMHYTLRVLNETWAARRTCEERFH